MIGLNEADILSRKKLGQINTFKVPSGRTYQQILLENAFTFINIILFVISVLLIFVGKISDGIIYFIVALLNILVGLIQEFRAKQKLDSMQDLVSPKSLVIRSIKNISIEKLIPVNEIVIDDIIKISSGEIIPVDGVVLEGFVVVDESILTGESDFINKITNENLMAGTTVVNGNCIFKVTQVGNQTLINKISSKAKVYTKDLTPIQQEVNLITRILFLVAATLGAMVTMAAYILRTPLEESLQIAAVVLGIIPNALFAMINLSYALGGVSILKQGALIQRLNAIESLSNVDVLCLDKTGTLTTKTLVLEEIIPIGVENDKSIQELLANFVATIQDHNATSSAILNKFATGTKYNNVTEIPFDSSYKWSAIEELNNIYILGATENVLKNTEIEIDLLNNKILEFQNKGLRVLIFVKKNKGLGTKITYDDKNKPILPEKLEPIALLVFSDTIREEARETLQNFAKADVKIKIISGDNPSTVLSLAKQIGLPSNIKMISGPELEELNENDWGEIVENTTIFGRITPEQKEKLIATLNHNGHYTAMIGDGVNDVMSIKQAKLGIAMQSGSPATRSVADILLLNDSFASLPSGLMEGQKIRNSLENIFKIYLVKILYLTLLILAVRVVGLPFPFTIKQNSLISLFTTGIPAIGFALWSHTGKKDSKSLFESVLHFVLPSALLMSFYGVFLFFGLTVLELFKIKTDLNLLNLGSISSPQFADAIQLVIPQLQTSLTIFIIFAGLILSIFVSPPVKKLAFGARSKRDFRPTFLAVSLVLVFCFVYIYAPFANFWELKTLKLNQIGIIFLTLICWLISLIYFWRFRLVDKFLNIKLKR
jgi:cation-transporting P-type ATPase E